MNVRFFGQRVAALCVATTAAALGLVATAGPASATAVVPVVNADGGVYWRSAPDWNSAIQNPGHGVYTGDRVQLNCYERGGTVPPYNNNPLWYQATVVSGRGVGSGLVNDHFLNTGTDQPNIPVSGVPACGSTGPTAAEQGAVNWAQPYANRHDTSYNGLCLKFTFDAYSAAGVNLRNWVNVPIGSNTYPQDIWGHFTHGSTGTGTPPFGALVFYNATSGHGKEYSHVTLSTGGGNTISSSDTYAGYTHTETLAQHASVHPYNTYVGWWLPDR